MLRREGHGIELLISDDGVGGAADTGAGMGIDNMRQRAATLPGGGLILHSPAMGGTQLHLQFVAEEK